MPIRLLHLSDIHFGSENTAALEAAVAFARTTPFDLLVLSGDITQLGHPDEFAATRAWLSELPTPWLSTPGNHDTPWMGLVERVTQPFQAYEQSIGPAADSFAAPGLAVDAINSARGWQIRWNWSKGEVSRRQALDAAARLTAAQPEAARILVCHHPLVEAIGEPITARTRGGRSAAKIMVEAGVDVVLSGHLHAPFVQALPFGDGLSYGVGAGTLSLRERGVPPGFNVVEIDVETLLVVSMAWQDGHLAEHRRWSAPLRPRRSVS